MPHKSFSERTIKEIVAFHNGYPTLVRNALVMPTADGKNLRVIDIAEACSIIRAKAMPITFDCPDDLQLVRAQANIYNTATL